MAVAMATASDDSGDGGGRTDSVLSFDEQEQPVNTQQTDDTNFTYSNCFDSNNPQPSYLPVGLPPMMNDTLPGAVAQHAGGNHQEPTTFLPNPNPPPLLTPTTTQPTRYSSPPAHLSSPEPRKNSHSASRKRHSTKKKKKKGPQQAEISVRPAEEQRLFHQVHANRQHQRVNITPLGEHNYQNTQNQNTMGRTRSTNQPDKSTETDPSRGKSHKLLTLDGKKIEMPRSNAELKKLLKEVILKHETLRKKIKPMEEQISSLTADLLQLEKSTGKTTKNSQAEKELEKTYARYFWRTCKFVQCEEDERKLLAKIYDKMFDADEQKDLGSSHKSTFVNTYVDCVSSVINGQRLYVQGRVRESFCQFGVDNGFLPTVEELAACALRTIDMGQPRNITIMDWYGKELLGTYLPVWLFSACLMPFFLANSPTIPPLLPQIYCVGRSLSSGNATTWKAEMAYYTPLTEAKDKENYTLFTASTEAMLITFVKSNETKWGHQVEYYKANGGNVKAHLPKKMNKKALEAEKAKNPNFEDPNAKYHIADFTSSDAGRVEHATYSQQGLMFYGKMLKSIKHSRKNEVAAIKQFEKDFMAGLKQRDGIAADATGPGKKKRGRGKKSVAVAEDPTPKKMRIELEEDSDSEATVLEHNSDENED